MGSALPSKTRTGPRLVLQPASRRAARHTSTSALRRFFAIADAWELSPLQQCRLLKIPSPQVLERYRLGQAPRLSATQQERAALIANIQYSLTADASLKDRAWAWVHAPREAPPFEGDSPLSFMLENGLPAPREAPRRRPPLCAQRSPGRLGYTRELFRCECGGIGRRARLRTWWGNPCEFESRLSHQRVGRHCPQQSEVTRIDMQVSVESISKLERRMQVQVPAERVTKEIAARLQKLSRTARLNGFRPGKAPIKVIRQQFGQQVHREVIGELLQSSFAEAVTEKQLSPAGNPRIEPQSMDEGQDLKYVATFEVFPEVALQPLDSLELEKITAEVTESDIDAMIERLRKQQMKYSPVTRAAAAGDKATIDFEGAIDGVPFAGGKGENIAIVLGEGRMLPELEQGLVGASLSEKRDVAVNFPADYRATELAGKQAIFATQVKSVEEPVLPEVDEEFCKA